FDKDLPNSWVLQQTCPELLRKIDVANPLNPLMSIASPKMLRDLSAGRKENGQIISSIQFKIKNGMSLFGERITDENTRVTSSNQYFNSWTDYMAYTGNMPDGYSIGYKGNEVSGEVKTSMEALTADPDGHETTPEIRKG